MKRLITLSTLLLFLLSLTAGCDDPAGIGNGTAEAPLLTRVSVSTFQQTEVVPNTALADPQPVPGSEAVLTRFDGGIRAQLTTHDLPPGAYTFWWHLVHEDEELSILWGGNHIVSHRSETVQIASTLIEGTENAPGFIFLGNGLQPGAARTVRAELWVRLHGPPSDDPAILREQLTRPFGTCTDVRNPNPRPELDYPCWNPQRAVFGYADGASR